MRLGKCQNSLRKRRFSFMSSISFVESGFLRALAWHSLLNSLHHSCYNFIIALQSHLDMIVLDILFSDVVCSRSDPRERIVLLRFPSWEYTSSFRRHVSLLACIHQAFPTNDITLSVLLIHALFITL